MPTETLHRRRRALSAGIATSCGGVLALGVLLWRYPPEQYSFYPRCPIHEYLHVLCPGCGGTRAAAALAHGHLREALHWNALVTVLLPLLLVYAAVCCWRAWHEESFGWPQPPAWMVQAGLAAALLFTVARNLP